MASSISVRAARTSCRRRAASFSRHFCSRSFTRAGVAGGSACQSGSRVRIAATVSDRVAPENARLLASNS